MTKIELELVTLKEIEPGSKTGFTDLFLMLFKEKDGERLLPVFIGGHEARSILLQIHRAQLEMPLIYDTMAALMRNNAITLSHVCIVDRQNERFYSKLFFVADGLEQVYDSRTSDAVLLAIKHNVPIYVDDDILEQVKDKVQLQHTDNAPVEMFNDDELEGVMQRAIADENYERASLLRDEIQKRKRTASDSL